MSVKTTLSKNALYLAAVIFLTSGIYGICDYYLHSVAKEVMLNWVDTEAIAIQEGNLLTSITKTQRFLISSSYIKGVKLVKADNDSLESKIEFGKPFNLLPEDLDGLKSELTQKRIGFLHQRAFYQIPKKEGMVLVFDVQSGFLIFLFAVSSSLIVLIVVYLIWALQKLEQKEAKKREELLKIAINDLLLKDSPSKILENEIPDLVKWWNVKKVEIDQTKKTAIEQQSKILLGEIASRAVHDIKGALRNVREISKHSEGLTVIQQNIFDKSLEKISKVSQSLLEETKLIHAEENKMRIQSNIKDLITEVVNLKQAQYGSTNKIDLDLPDYDVESILDPTLFDRSLSNLIDNAIEASTATASVKVKLTANKGQLTVQVSDSGIGISNENLQKIGTKGFTDGKSNGTGLGVFYAKQFVQDLGGKFEIKSELNAGTTISMHLPAIETTKQEIIEVKPDQQILILEDQLMNRIVANLKFKKAGVPTSFYSIFAKVEELEEWLTKNESDFKLYSDYHLVDENGKTLENGVEVIKRLDLAQKSSLFTSASNDPDVIDRAKELGVPVLSKEQFFNAEVRFL